MPVHLDKMDDFVVELTRDLEDGAIDHKIVRMASPVVVGNKGAVVPIVGTKVGYRARGEIVELTVVAGDLWSRSIEHVADKPFSDQDQSTRESLAATEKAITDLCAQHALDLRKGAFQ